ncbi:MAG: hypothetical protein SOH58_08715 [Olsenella sp.]|jgi:hypothetical protein
MLKFFLERVDGDDIVFAYLPEGDGGDMGTVIWDSKKNDARVGSKAREDDYTIYARHLMKRLRDEFAEHGKLPESGEVAWY